MAEEVTEGTAKAGSFLAKKVGPLPIGVWLVAGVGIYYYFSRKQAAAVTPADTTSGQQTDSAGNTGYIDPSTGFVAGSAEDTAALQQQADSSSSGSGSSNNPAAGTTYSDNNAWGRAAINYLVGLGVDPSTANQAIELYLGSQPLTPAQQADVNESIQALGPPPDLPGPTSTNPPPITNPPGGGTPPPSGGGGGQKPPTGGGGRGVKPPKPPDRKPPPVHEPKPGKTVPVPTNFVVSDKSNHSVRVTWRRVNGATGYHLAIYPIGSQARTDQDVGPESSTAVFSGLHGGKSYNIDLWAKPGPANGPHARVSVALPK